MHKFLINCAITALLITLAAEHSFAQKIDLGEDAWTGKTPASIGKWTSAGPARLLSKQEISALSDNDVLAEFGLQSVRTRKYSLGKAAFTSTIIEFKHSAGSYGMFTYDKGVLRSNQKEFYAGKFLIRLVRHEVNEPLVFDALIENAARRAMDASEIPFIQSVLPTEGKNEGSEKYILGPLVLSRLTRVSGLPVDFTGGTHAVLAEYGEMTLILVEYQTPQFGTDGAAVFQQQFEKLSPDDKKKTVVRRVGNYLVEAINATDPKAADALIGKIKYQPRVYWEGKDIKALPEGYRPPDPWVIDESIRTGRFVVAAFNLIGAMGLIAIILGIFSGAAFFYWRRSRNRKLGVDTEFTEPGGMTRLNIEQDLLAEGDRSGRLPGKGE